MKGAFDFAAAADAAERAANSPEGQAERAAVYAILHHLEEIQIALANQALQRCSGPPPGHERLPLRAEGDDFGRVEARIPKALFFGLMQQKNFGYAGLTDSSGVKDLLKAYPQCRVKTVSGKTTVGYTGESAKLKAQSSNVRTRGRVYFAPGTLQLAT